MYILIKYQHMLAWDDIKVEQKILVLHLLYNLRKPNIDYTPDVNRISGKNRTYGSSISRCWRMMMSNSKWKCILRKANTYFFNLRGNFLVKNVQIDPISVHVHKRWYHDHQDEICWFGTKMNVIHRPLKTKCFPAYAFILVENRWITKMNDHKKEGGLWP